MYDNIIYEHIIYDVRDPVATITLNRPESLNAWTMRMAAEVRHAVAAAEADRRVVGIVITGAGRGFCAGADLNLLAGIRDGSANLRSDVEGLETATAEPLPPDFDGECTYLLATKKPVVAAINGAVAGIAVPLILCCDIRFMAEDAPLLTAFSQRGLVAEWGVAWLLPRLVGTGRALDLLFSSRRVSGTECAAMGLVNAALPAEDVLPHAIRYVEELAEKCAPASLAIMKRQVYEQLSASLGPSEKEAHKLMRESFAGAAFKEGLAAFLEKRSPRFERIGSPE
ncbi:MAG: enoyl-CoA hydratase/isomerase family protein [Acidimicrobiales bacterium]|nr:enoyl-CoA hydratase/isomerase family protein [Acidimicrobiales bacterium]